MTKKTVTVIPKAKNPDDVLSNFDAFIELIKILRKECPWDRKQTNKSIAPLTIEEAYEVNEALYNDDYDELSKELGDILLHVVMHAVIAEETDKFNLTDVIQRIHSKLVYRHPHVFGDDKVKDDEDVLQNWEKLKMKEGKKSVLEGVPSALPALLRAERMQHKASRIGFDWDDKSEVWNKVYEELDELKAEMTAGNKEKAKEEFGDFLFALVNAARHEDIVAEEALQITNKKFKDRFQYIEHAAKERGLALTEMTLEEMDAIWDEAKVKGL
jgi:MazG family protein